jgi:hypothetical protein
MPTRILTARRRAFKWDPNMDAIGLAVDATTDRR